MIFFGWYKKTAFNAVYSKGGGYCYLAFECSLLISYGVNFGVFGLVVLRIVFGIIKKARVNDSRTFNNQLDYYDTVTNGDIEYKYRDKF